jgi:hypothetical protein
MMRGGGAVKWAADRIIYHILLGPPEAVWETGAGHTSLPFERPAHENHGNKIFESS